MNILRRNLMLIKEDCGEVCDTSNNFIRKSGIHFDQISKNFQCEYLFESPIIENSTKVSEQIVPPDLNILPKDIQQQYTFEGRIPLLYHYMNGIEYFMDAKQIVTKTTTKSWNRKHIEIGQERYRNNVLVGGYGTEVVVNMTILIKKYMHEHVLDGHILVVGSQTPWIEIMLLELGAAKITTLEYDVIRTDHPKIEIITPENLRHAYLKGKAPTFDAMVSFSSLEHSGLGRYGDSLNPWGDLITMAKVWCLMKPKGRALVGVPSGLDVILFNACRNYGPIMSSHLFANWNVIYSQYLDINDKSIVKDFCEENSNLFYCFQPLTVIEKPDIVKAEL